MTALLSERKLDPTDYDLIRTVLTAMVDRLKRTGRKAVHGYLDVQSAMDWLAEHDNVYIINESYLVAYDIGTPWYAAEDVSFLQECLVLAIAISGDFTAIPVFLERKAREAGAVLVLAGTALANSDNALASLYHPAGYVQQSLTLVKEL